MTGELAATRRDAQGGGAEPSRSRVVTLTGFEGAVPLPDEQGDAFRRRFVTLFVDEGRSRRGGLGRVSFARNPLGEPVAIKELIVPEREEGESRAGYSRRVGASRAAFRQEYECHRALSGTRGFPRLYGWGHVGKTPAIVMEWVEGETLSDVAGGLAVDAAGRVSPLVAARLGRELFGLLALMGRVDANLVHRDVSAANVMVRTDRLPVARQVEEGSFDLCLIDFGSATAGLSAEAGSSFTMRSHAVRGATADYAPPEMLTQDLPGIDALRKSPSIDVFAAASVVYELLCGRLPFDLRDGGAAGAPVSAYRAKTERMPRRPLGAHAPGADLGEVLAREPEVAVAAARAVADLGRKPTAEEVRRALELVDGQLADMLMPCLSVSQGDRPSAAAMRDALSAFCSSYADNVRAALFREPLSPSTVGLAWLPLARHHRAWRAVRVAGRVVAALSWLCVAAVTAVLSDGTPVRLPAFGDAVGLTLTAPVALVALAAPAALALAVRGRESDSRAAFLRATGALAASALLLCGALLVARPLPAARAQGLLSAVLACSAATWLALVLDYVVPIAPALIAERARLAASRRRRGLGPARGAHDREAFWLRGKR